MSFRPDTTQVVQDMPPRGGYPIVDITRKARARGPTGMQIWAASTLAIAYGFYSVGQLNKRNNGEKLENRKARFAMAPALQAEEDRFYIAREMAIVSSEAEIMKNVPGWKAGESTFTTERWVPRNIAPLDRNIKK